MCCGDQRKQLQATTSQTQKLKAGSRPAPDVLFEYVGHSAQIVVGPVTRRQYHFNWPGDRVLVDPRDAPSVAAVPNLREMR